MTAQAALLRPVLCPAVWSPRYGRDLHLETVAILDAMTVKPSAERRRLMNRLVADLLYAGLWSKLGNLYVLAAHDAQAARINWVAPGTGDLTAVNSPTFTADRGYAGDGATSYLTSGAVFRAPYALNSAHVGAWSNTDVAESGGTIGVVRATAATTRLLPRSAAGDLNTRVNTGTANTIAVADSLGHSLASRTGASAGAIYKNGASIGTIVAASTAAPTEHVAVCRADGLYATQRVAAAHAGSGLAAAEAAALHAALLAFLTPIGAA